MEAPSAERVARGLWRCCARCEQQALLGNSAAAAEGEASGRSMTEGVTCSNAVVFTLQPSSATIVIFRELNTYTIDSLIVCRHITYTHVDCRMSPD